jgi:hypothetical protein
MEHQSKIMMKIKSEITRFSHKVSGKKPTRRLIVLNLVSISVAGKRSLNHDRCDFASELKSSLSMFVFAKELT